MKQEGIKMSRTRKTYRLSDEVEQWYKLYQTDMLKKGKEIPDLNLIDMSTYQKTGEMSTDEYINTGDKKVAEANQKYEKSSTNKIPLAEEEKGYEFYEGNKLYQKITIDKATLVLSVIWCVMVVLNVGKDYHKTIASKGRKNYISKSWKW